MKQLVFIENGRPVTDSLTVAEVFGKSHDNVMRDIRNQIEKLHQAGEGEWGSLNFDETQYQNPQNKQWYSKFNMTEDAFTIVAMGYTTPEAMKMKVRFIQEFKKLREQLAANVVPLSKDQALVTVLRTTADLMEGQEELKREQQELKKMVLDVNRKVEEQITLDHGEQRAVQKAVARKVYELESDPKRRRELFRQLHREIKDRWAVPSYRDVRRSELQQVLRYIDAWMPRKVS